MGDNRCQWARLLGELQLMKRLRQIKCREDACAADHVDDVLDCFCGKTSAFERFVQRLGVACQAHLHRARSRLSQFLLIGSLLASWRLCAALWNNNKVADPWGRLARVGDAFEDAVSDLLVELTAHSLAQVDRDWTKALPDWADLRIDFKRVLCPSTQPSLPLKALGKRSLSCSTLSLVRESALVLSSSIAASDRALSLIRTMPRRVDAEKLSRHFERPRTTMKPARTVDSLKDKSVVNCPSRLIGSTPPTSTLRRSARAGAWP